MENYTPLPTGGYEFEIGCANCGLTAVQIAPNFTAAHPQFEARGWVDALYGAWHCKRCHPLYAASSPVAVLATPTSTPTSAGLTDEQRDALKLNMTRRMKAEYLLKCRAVVGNRYAAAAEHQSRHNAFYEVWCALETGQL